MKRFIRHIALLLLVFLGIATLISVGSFYALRNSSFYKPSFLVNSVVETDFDYIILGSSVGLTTLDTKVIDSINSTTGINLSVDDTGMSSQYLMLQHFLAEGKKTKYCILVPGIAALENKTAAFGDNDYRFLMYVSRDYVYDYYKQANIEAAKISYMTKWLPFVGLAYYNTELFFPSLNSLFKPKRRNRFDERGNYSYPIRNKDFRSNNIKTQLITFDHPYLNEIEALCKKNNIELIYYFAPMRTTVLEYSSPRIMIMDHSQILRDDEFFYDDIHVNYMGRGVISELFANGFHQISREIK